MQCETLIQSHDSSNGGIADDFSGF